MMNINYLDQDELDDIEMTRVMRRYWRELATMAYAQGDVELGRFYTALKHLYDLDLPF